MRHLSPRPIVFAVLAMILLHDQRSIARAAAPSNSPSEFYARLVEAIDSFEGHALLYFNPGHWQTFSRVAGNIHWSIDDGTVADIEVRYVHRALVTASVKLNKPVHVWYPGAANGVSFKFTSFA